jgi:hypothetical protein
VPITQVHSFLVHPAKNEDEPPDVRGARLPLHGKLFQMLNALYANADEECDIEIVFRPRADGHQDNDCRNLLVSYIDDPAMDSGRAIAARLQSVTTHRSGLGLLFLVIGSEGQQKRLILARFPADQGVIAQERERRLDVEFIERVFMKSAKAYKSALYMGAATDGGFWDGRAVDKQINNVRELSNYWISEFLDSELRTTGPAGTKRLAIALRQAIRSTNDANVRRELLAAAELLRGQHGRRVSPERVARNLRLSPASVAAITDALPRSELFSETFQFDREEFDRHVFYRSVELDNGAFLIGENAEFDTIFQKQPLQVAEDRVRYTTEGRIVKEQLRKTL